MRKNKKKKRILIATAMIIFVLSAIYLKTVFLGLVSFINCFFSVNL